MLSAEIFGKMQSGFNQVVDVLGVPAEYHQTKVPKAVTNIAAVGFKSPKPDEEAIINAIGVSGRIVTIQEADLPVPPVKLDRLFIHGEVWTVEAVNRIDLNGTIIGYKLLCKGR